MIKKITVLPLEMARSGPLTAGSKEMRLDLLLLLVPIAILSARRRSWARTVGTDASPAEDLIDLLEALLKVAQVAVFCSDLAHEVLDGTSLRQKSVAQGVGAELGAGPAWTPRLLLRWSHQNVHG